MTALQRGRPGNPEAVGCSCNGCWGTRRVTRSPYTHDPCYLCAGGLEGAPDLEGGGRHVELFDAGLAEGVQDGAADGRGAADGAGLADALGAERVSRREGLGAVEFEHRERVGGRHGVIAEGAGEEL